MPDANPTPEIPGNLRSTHVRLPDSIRECSGITVLNRHIRSLLFSTDVALIRNANADAVIAVYPFTPQPIITNAIILAGDIPVFCGVGAAWTPVIAAHIRALHRTFPIIATGGRTDETIRQTIQTGTNAITFTPPTTGALYKQLMDRYRRQATPHADDGRDAS